MRPKSQLGARQSAHGEPVEPQAQDERARAVRPDLALNVIDFVRLLRANDFLVTSSHSEDALRALQAIDIGDHDDFYLALRSVLLWDPRRRAAFDELFERFWGSAVPSSELRVPTEERSVLSPESSGLTYSPLEALVEKDFSDFEPDDLDAVARACVEIARHIATRKSRRVKPTLGGSRIDPRRSFRRNVKHGGTVLELARFEHKIRKPRIVVICDVSRSMEPYSVFLLQFVHSIQNVIGRVESFVFSTRLHRVSGYFRRANIRSALDDIAHEVPDWSGGTRIGESLKALNETYAPALVDRRTSVVILSDGLDTGQMDLLAREMAALHQRAAIVIWLNPLLGAREYRPVAAGMAAALPFVDVFAPAHNLASLRQLATLLARGRAPSPAAAGTAEGGGEGRPAWPKG